MNKYYDCLSLNLATYLKMKGFPIVKAEKTSKGVIFYFNRTKEIFEVVTEYNQNAELKSFISEFKNIKQIVSSFK